MDEKERTILFLSNILLSVIEGDEITGEEKKALERIAYSVYWYEIDHSSLYLQKELIK